MGLFSDLFSHKKSINFKELIIQGAIIVDVRSPEEYKTGHIPGSINIELGKVNTSIQFLQKKKKSIITVCRSGNRSAIALNIIKSAGMEVYNGGAWNDLQKKIA